LRDFQQPARPQNTIDGWLTFSSTRASSQLSPIPTSLPKGRRKLRRELDALLDLEPTNRQGNHLRAAMFVDCRERLLVFMTRRDVEPTNNASERELQPSVIFRKVTNGFRSNWGAKAHADLRSIVATARLTGISALAAVRSVLAPARASGLADP